MKLQYQILFTIAFILSLTCFNTAQAFHFPWDQGHDTTDWGNPDDVGTPDNPVNNCGKGQGSPVYVASGNLIWKENDISLSGRPNISVNRTYNSHDPRSGIFGNGWSSNCDPTLKKVDNGDGTFTYIYRVEDGKRYEYVEEADGSITAPSGHFNSIQIVAGLPKITSKSGVSQSFNLVGQLTQWTNLNGITKDYEYDAEGKITKIKSDSRFVSFSYDTNGHVSGIQDHSGRTWVYAYDADGNLVSVTDPIGGIRTFEYQVYTDKNDGFTYYQLTKITDESGVILSSVTYKGNRVSNYTDAANNYSYSYDTNNKKATKKDSTSRTYRYAYNDEQIVTQISDPSGNTVNLEYDINGNVTKFTDQLGKEWTSTYDIQGRKLTTTSPLGRTQKWEYQGDSPKPNKIITPLGNTTVIDYDAKLNPVAITDAKGNKVLLTVDTNGNITAIKDAKGKQSAIAYNIAGLPITVTDAKGNTSTFTYDNLGRKDSSTDAEGRTTTYVYDDLDRLLSTSNALNHVTSFTYDEAGRLLTLTDPVGNVTQSTYDTFGSLIKEKRPDGGETTYTYDAANLLTTINRYDGKTISLSYDAAMLLSSESVDGDIINYVYDARGDHTSVSNSTASLNYTYDDDGDVVSEDQAGITLDRTYNDDGALTQLKYLSETLDYSRDKLSGLSKLVNGTDTFDLSYDVNNVLTAIGLPNSLNETYSYDDIYNLTKIATGASTLDYVHDKTGLITSKTRDGAATNYTYDDIARLTKAGSDSYIYDTAGNELSNSASYESTTNRLNSNSDYTFTYDTAGNLTQKKRKDGTQTKNYTFNVRNQLIKVETLDGSNAVTKTFDFTYDPLGRRYSKSVDSTIKYYVYDGVDIVATIDGSGNTLSTIVHYESADTPLSITTGGNTYYYHRNHQGSIIALTDSSGTVVEVYAYDAYGKTTKTGSTSTGNTYAYTGRELDDDDLYYYRARYYDPTTQRFLSEDPIGFNSGDYNFYRYVGNTPVNLTDPTGKCGTGLCVAVIGGGYYMIYSIYNSWNDFFDKAEEARKGDGSSPLRRLLVLSHYF